MLIFKNAKLQNLFVSFSEMLKTFKNYFAFYVENIFLCVNKLNFE